MTAMTANGIAGGSVEETCGLNLFRNGTIRKRVPSKIRNPKHEIRNKSEGGNAEKSKHPFASPCAGGARFEFSVLSPFRACFGFRNSSFGFGLQAKPALRGGRNASGGRCG
jgi:hypothetical protein